MYLGQNGCSWRVHFQCLYILHHQNKLDLSLQETLILFLHLCSREGKKKKFSIIIIIIIIILARLQHYLLQKSQVACTPPLHLYHPMSHRIWSPRLLHNNTQLVHCDWMYPQQVVSLHFHHKERVFDLSRRQVGG